MIYKINLVKTCAEQEFAKIEGKFNCNIDKLKTALEHSGYICTTLPNLQKMIIAKNDKIVLFIFSDGSFHFSKLRNIDAAHSILNKIKI